MYLRSSFTSNVTKIKVIKTIVSLSSKIKEGVVSDVEKETHLTLLGEQMSDFRLEKEVN